MYFVFAIHIIEPFAALFWALGIGLAHIMKHLTQPASLASLNSGTGTDQFESEDASANCFSNLAIYYLYMNEAITV